MVCAFTSRTETSSPKPPSHPCPTSHQLTTILANSPHADAQASVALRPRWFAPCSTTLLSVTCCSSTRAMRTKHDEAINLCPTMWEGSLLQARFYKKKKLEKCTKENKTMQAQTKKNGLLSAAGSHNFSKKLRWKKCGQKTGAVVQRLEFPVWHYAFGPTSPKESLHARFFEANILCS